MIDQVLDGRRRWLVVNGDCMEAMRLLPPASVEAVITDPPYGISYSTRKGARVKNDHRPFIWWLQEAHRVTARNGALICFCRWDVQEVFRVAIEAAGFRIRSQVIWDRLHHGLGNLRQQFAPRHDCIWFATKGRFSFPGGRPRSVLTRARVDYRKAHHPTEKPIELMEDLVEAVCPEGGVVVDPCAGSGSTGVGAVRRGRRFIGVELDPMHAETSTYRINAAAPDETGAAAYATLAPSTRLELRTSLWGTASEGS